MDYGFKFSELERQEKEIERDFAERTKELLADIASAKEDLNRAKDFTEKLLAECGKRKVKAVAIGISDKRVPASINFCFGSSGNVFAMGKDPGTPWPAIWGACDAAGIKSSCGNSNQKQLSDDSQLIGGLYLLKDGKWSKVK